MKGDEHILVVEILLDTECAGGSDELFAVRLFEGAGCIPFGDEDMEQFEGVIDIDLEFIAHTGAEDGEVLLLSGQQELAFVE